MSDYVRHRGPHRSFSAQPWQLRALLVRPNPLTVDAVLAPLRFPADSQGVQDALRAVLEDDETRRLPLTDESVLWGTALVDTVERYDPGLGLAIDIPQLLGQLRVAASIMTLTGHDERVFGVATAPDGTIITSSDDDF
ncbi:Trp-Asp (WD) repeats circular [Carpediemonas membranifera]|uniref:Trp-Asp (WD) repeats circular n=1 Tax=Carpediemonas membranifera TaxID=201153 RepID=A0A8J6E1Z4_9EUKA|nr:Trp-Asp (WD) repeats circular [Carpediemonas membranifera]|eukprot:KAG9393671.1 Trp-Asp (WD) repeats circular [Carpediemonas membranifera]